jgi:hypothetical protein
MHGRRAGHHRTGHRIFVSYVIGEQTLRQQRKIWQAAMRCRSSRCRCAINVVTCAEAGHVDAPAAVATVI